MNLTSRTGKCCSVQCKFYAESSFERIPVTDACGLVRRLLL